jgi:hypothetical protein
MSESYFPGKYYSDERKNAISPVNTIPTNVEMLFPW